MANSLDTHSIERGRCLPGYAHASHPWTFSEVSEMKTLKIAAVLAFALMASHSWAQDTSAPSQPTQAQANQDTGGMSNASQNGAPMGLTRAQVKQDLIHAEKSGELTRLNTDLYRGQ